MSDKRGIRRGLGEYELEGGAFGWPAPAAPATISAAAVPHGARDDRPGLGCPARLGAAAGAADRRWRVMLQRIRGLAKR